VHRRRDARRHPRRPRRRLPRREELLRTVWRPGDEPGRRQFVTLPAPFALEAGGRLDRVDVAYETWGTLAADASNAVLVLHALTGDSHATGPGGPGHRQAGWWSTIIGPAAPLDTDELFVVAPNVLGGCQGTTGPGSDAADGRPYGSRFPVVTPRDQVAVEAALADALGIECWAAVVGGSMGGMRALEWAVGFPARVARAIVIAVGAAATAEQIGLCSLQTRVIRADPQFANGDYYGRGEGPELGMAIARGIGQVGYRSEPELDERFGRRAQDDEEPLAGGRYAIESYLEHQGDSLDARFDANTYIVLSEAMNHHDVGRGRGGIASALARIEAEVTVAGISSDRLYPLRLQREIAAGLSRPTDIEVIHSMVGHDGFLVEQDALGKIIRHALSRTRSVRHGASS
jgi:homoserine O-acetyltransferase/O-succinyltransferase